MTPKDEREKKILVNETPSVKEYSAPSTRFLDSGGCTDSNLRPGGLGKFGNLLTSGLVLELKLESSLRLGLGGVIRREPKGRKSWTHFIIYT